LIMTKLWRGHFRGARRPWPHELDDEMVFIEL
jgi:hypothetical protein